MPRAVAAIDVALPLFAWPEIAAVAAERAELGRRIAMLPRFSHRRVILDARLRSATERQLRLEAQMKERPL